MFTVVNDPVGSGFVESWARPGGNITGFANFEPSIAGKWLEVLKEIAPDVTRVAILFNPETAPGHGSTFIDPLDQAAPSLGLKLVHAPVQEDRAIEDVGAKLAREPGGGIITIPDFFTLALRQQIVDMATRYRLPGAYPYSSFSKIGGLISYGADTIDLHRRATSYVDRILRGAKPADLPVQPPTKFELVINMKTAKALGLEIPPMLLARRRGDRVIIENPRARRLLRCRVSNWHITNMPPPPNNSVSNWGVNGLKSRVAPGSKYETEVLISRSFISR